MNILNLFRKKTTEAVKEKTPEVFNFYCHHCNKGFNVTDLMIFPTSVRLLYKDQYVQGKGVTCPHCHKDSIFG
jgi:hypothetical protein